MKKTILTVISVIVCMSVAFAQSSDLAIVKGVILKKNVPESITLYKVVNGEAVLHSKVQVAKDGSFGFVFTPEPAGFYRIGERNSQTRLYVSPGKNISVQVTDTSFTVQPSDVENSKLQEWSNIIWGIKKANQLAGNFTFKEIFPIIPDLEKRKNSFLSSINSGNAEFDNLLKGLVGAEFEYELYHFLFMPRAAHPTESDMPEIYNRVSNTLHFVTTEAMKYDFGQAFVSSFIQYKVGQMAKKSGKDFNYRNATFSACQENIKNDTLKGWYLINTTLLHSKAYDQAYRDNLAKVSPYILTTDQKGVIARFEKSIRTFSDGEQAINFVGSTVEGKKVSLTDFKGKVVLLDVWATWCGPCKKEIPSLKKLEEEFHAKDIVFISYSIDELKDLDKWKKMIVDEQLKGVQLIGSAAWKSPICSDYTITGVPRFMVFDKNGKIVTIDAPRPSNPELKALLEKELLK